MSEEVFSVELEIQNRKGLHARAAAAFVKTIENINAKVEVERMGQVVNGNSIMGLMMLAASQGTTVRVSATGLEAAEAIAKLTELIKSKFGEE